MARYDRRPPRRRHPRDRRVGRGRGRPASTEDAAAAEPAGRADSGERGRSGGGIALQPTPTAIDRRRSTRRRRRRRRRRRHARVDVAPATRAKLRRLLETLDELDPADLARGPVHVLEEYVEQHGPGPRPASRSTRSRRSGWSPTSRASCASPPTGRPSTRAGTLAGFVDYLDAYQSAGGELPTSVELTEDVDGVRLMTLYQAKGLEFPLVFVPQLLKDEWPAREYGSGLLPEGPAPRGRPRRRHPHRGGAPAPVRGAHARARPAGAHDARRAGARRRSRRCSSASCATGPGAELSFVDRGRAGRCAGGRRTTPVAPTARRPRVMPVPTARERGSRCGSGRTSCSSCSRARPDRPGGGRRPAPRSPVEFADVGRPRSATAPTRLARAASTR